MVLTVSFVISSAIGLFCRRHQWKCFRQFNASVEASGPHDFAVRIDARRLRASMRPSHPAPSVRDDREAPLLEERGTAEHGGDLGVQSMRARCGTLARRANQLRLAKPCQVMSNCRTTVILRRKRPVRRSFSVGGKRASKEDGPHSLPAHPSRRAKGAHLRVNAIAFIPG
jgi:hypothetical protein